MYEIAGFAGVAFYLGSYAALQLGLISGRGYLYAALNLIGAALVLISLIAAFNLFSAIIQISWIVISLVGMARVFFLSRMIRFSEAEAQIIANLLSGLGKVDMRKVLNLGTWVESPPGTVITREGEPVENLCWVHAGRISVEIGGRQVAELGAAQVIGEATCLSEDPATATTVTAEPSSLFLIPSSRLKELASRNPAVMAQLHDSFSAHLRAKLLRSNQSAAAKADAEPA